MRCELGSGGVSPGPSSEPSWSARRGQGRCQVGLTRSRAALGIAERSRKPVQPAEPWGERVGGRGPPPEPPQCGVRWQQRGLEVAGVYGRGPHPRGKVATSWPHEDETKRFRLLLLPGSPGAAQDPTGALSAKPAGSAGGLLPPPHPHTGEQMFPLSHRHHFGLSRIEPLPASSHHAQSLLDSSKTATPPSGSSERDFELRVASVRWRCSQVMRPPPLTASHTR